MADRAYIGRFREKVIFQSSARTLSARGVPELTWTTQATMFAEVEEAGASEAVINENIDAQRTITVRCYKVANLNHSWRILWDSVYWDITSVSPETGRPFVRITATKYMQ